jgi:DNA-binding FrmR family transcriptional regulator
MRIDDKALSGVLRRMHRAEGQLHGVITMLESGRDCDEVLVQLAAVTHALDRAGFAIVAEGLRQCLTTEDSGEEQRKTMDHLEKLFMTLA